MLSAVVMVLLSSSESFDFEDAARADRSETVQRPTLQPTARGATLLETDPAQVMVRSTTAGLLAAAVGFGGTLGSSLVAREIVRASFGDGSTSGVLFGFLVGVPVASFVGGLLMMATLGVMAVAMISLSGAEEAARRTAVIATSVAIGLVALCIIVLPFALPSLGLFGFPLVVGGLGLAAGVAVPVVTAALTHQAPEPTIPVARF